MKSLYFDEKYGLSVKSWNNILSNLNACIVPVIWDSPNKPLSMKSLISLTKPALPQCLTHNWMNLNHNFPGKRSNIKLCLSESCFWYSLWLPWKHHFNLMDEKLRWSTPPKCEHAEHVPNNFACFNSGQSEVVIKAKGGHCKY